VPLGNPRRIFVRTPRRHGARLSVWLLAAVSMAGVVAGGGAMLAGASTHIAMPLLYTVSADDPAVVDGETLRLGDHVLRLAGVAAPTRGESCGAAVDCGGAAALQLAALVREHRVDCRLRQTDGAGHAFADCQADGRNINQAVVASGWAVARSDAPGLRVAEARARAEHLGVWAEK
jgi:endonuclease YncB( thermonuclease family)